MHNMTNDQLVLQVNKINIRPDKTYVKYNQNERGKVIDINVIDNDGINAYDLTNKKIRFVDEKEDNKLIIDDEADNPSHFTRANDTQGKFSYTFHDLVYQRSGIARFEIYTDSDHIDATSNFEIQIENTASLVAANESYISSLEGLVAHYHNTVNTTVSETQQLINSLTDKINQAISKGQTDVANEVTNIRNIIQQMQAEYSSKRDTLNNLIAEWQNQSKSIKSAADQQRQSIQNSYNNQSSQNQTQFNSKMTEIESEKNAAIAKANTDFSNKLVDWQKDYDSWKSSKEADLTAQLKSITDQIASDKSATTQVHNEVVDIQKQIEDAKKAWDSLDFTKFVTGDQFKEAMSKKASGIKVRGLRGDYVMAVNVNDSNIDATPSTQQAGLVDSGVLAAAVQALADAILDKNHYTKQEVDGIKQNILDTITNKTKDMATTQDVAANAQRITALENAGFAKIKLDGFSTADDAKKWSADNNGIAMFADEPETV